MKTLRKTISDGIKTLYDVDFELGYLERGHVYVYAGEDNSLYETQLTYVWQNDTQIELTVPEEYVEGTVINIRRVAPRDTLYVLFKNSTGITQLALNAANLQALMLIEEQDDGFKPVGYYEKQDLSFDGLYTIKNLLNGVDPQDPVTMKQMFDTDEGFMSQFVLDATAQADRAETEADTSELAAAKAGDWAEKAEDVEVEAGKFSSLHHAAKSAESAASIELPDYSTGEAGEPIVRNSAGDGWELGPAASNHNVLINGNFDIWQRASSQATDGYGSDDRWGNIHTVSTKTHSRHIFTLGQTDVPNNPTYFSRTVVATGSTAASYVIKQQKVEGVAISSGKTVTLSFHAKADSTKNMSVEFAQYFGNGGTPSASMHALGVTKLALTTLWQPFKITVTLPSISGKTLGTNVNDYLQVLFWFDAGSDFDARTDSLGNQSGTFDISQVQLEVGPKATVFEHRTFGEELLLCQRYYYRITGGTSKTYIATAQWVSTTLCFSAFVYPQIMRDLPTLSISSITGFSVLGATGGNIVSTDVTSFAATIDAMRLSITTASGGTAGNATIQRIDSGEYLELNAEL